jgi:hypothetical protein
MKSFLKDCPYGLIYPICIAEDLLNLRPVKSVQAGSIVLVDVWGELIPPLGILCM